MPAKEGEKEGENDKPKNLNKDLSGETVLLGGGVFAGPKGYEKKGYTCNNGHTLKFEAYPYISYDRYKCSTCPMKGSGKRWCCAQCQYDLCPNCGIPPAGQEVACAKGHKLKWQSNPSYAANVYRCDKCGFELGSGDRMCCTICGYDMCYSCATPPTGKNLLLCKKGHQLKIGQNSSYANSTYRCDRCSTNASGPRFMCQECSFDLCNTCMPLPAGYKVESKPVAPPVAPIQVAPSKPAIYRGQKFSMLDYSINKCYFFTGNCCYCYDNGQDRVDGGQPRLISEVFKGVWADGFDTCFKWGDDIIYFFKGGLYTRYSIKDQQCLSGYPRNIQGNWPGLPYMSIDAAVYYPNGKAYFFHGTNYVRYDMKADKADENYPMDIAGQWHGVYANGIDSVCTWPRAANKLYFFKGNQYIRYDFNADKVDDGYPQDFARGWNGIPDL
jgi:hypothetical protein